MSRLLISLENELELQAIERNNNIVEKQCANFERQRNEVHRSLRHLVSCNSQVNRMALITKDKSAKVKNAVETHRTEAQKFSQQSFASLNSSFENVDMIRAMNHLSLHYGTPVLSITLPYDECIQKSIEEENSLRCILNEISLVKDDLNTDKESLAKDQQATSKAKAKVEKEMIQLQEELQRQTGITSLIQSSSTEINNILQTIKKQMVELSNQKASADLEMKAAETIRDELLQQLSTNETSSEATLATLDDVYSMLKADTFSDVLPNDNIPDLNEIQQLLNEWESLTAENADFPQPDAISDTDTSKTLEASLGSMKKDVKQTLKSVEQLKDCNAQLSAVSDTLTNKKTEIENVRKHIAENTATFTKLKVTENAIRISDSESRSSKKEEILRRLEATRNEVPGPVPYQPYQTPDQVASKTDKLKAKVVKRSSVASESTRNISNTGPQYPGIKLVVQPSAGKSPTSNENVSEELDVSINSDNSTDFSEYSGTTQNASDFNEFYGDLKNEEQDSPPVVEFSMAEHMTEFSQRQAKIKAKQAIKEVDVDVDKDDEVEVKPLDELEISAIDSEGEEEEDFDEEDEDLFAPEDQELDQSTWGDDD